MIETTGLADPAPVMQTLMTDTMLQAQYRLDCVVTLVDAVNGIGQLDTMSEPVKQAALADRLVITKSDLTDEDTVARLEARLRELNPQAPIRRAVNGEIDLAFMIGVGLANTRSRLEDVERWMGAEEHDADGHVHRHESSIRSFCLRYERPFTWATFSQCMEVLTAMRGPDLLRVKGLVNVEGRHGPLVVQGVQHLFHPPIELADWPSADRSTRIVFITRGIERATVENLFSAVASIADAIHKTRRLAMKWQTRSSALALAAVALSCTAAAQAQNYPVKPVRVIVPFTPGGISDVLARSMAQSLGASMGQQFVVENRPGAGTTIAGEVVAKSAPDGYTIYFIDMTTHAINATLYSRLPYDSVKDFTQIAMVAQTPLILVVHPSLPVKSVRELIAFAKPRPDQIVYASSGNGTILHLSGETLKSMGGIKMVHVPYKGSAQAVAGVLGGEVAVTFSTTPPALPHVQAGKLRALGVSSAQRSPLLPDVPALAETLKGFDIVLYNGIMGPAGIPRDIVNRLNKEIARMLTLPNIKDVWAKQGADPVVMTPEQVTEHLKSDIQKLGQMVRAAGAKID